MVMKAINKKLWRTIWNTKSQFLATAVVVALGITVYISMSTAYYNLNRSQERFYQENIFADYFFHVVKAPEQITKQIEAIPGVIHATGRIQKDVPVIKENQQRADVRLVSYPIPMEREVNQLRLLSGRMFEEHPQGGGIEVLTDPQFTAVNHLLNNQVTIVAEGKQVPLTVVGTATSPEFIYAIKDAAELVPDPTNFGIVMLPHSQAQQVLNLNGQINQVVVKFAPGANQEDLARQIKAILEPYGNLASYPRKQQISHAVLQAKLDGIKAMVNVLPMIFLGMAAAIQMVMVGRLIKSQRLSIGIMKALGYDNRQIMMHYLSYALIMSVMGALMGIVFGLILAQYISNQYALYFNLPQAVGGLNLKAIVYGVLITVVVGALAGFTASRGVMSINPAEAMRPEPPKRGGRTIFENWSGFWGRLSPEWKMSLRTISRNKGRFVIVLVGVIFSVSMMMIALMENDSIDYLIKNHYGIEQQYNYFVRFNTPVKESELLNLSRLEGVTRSEPVFEVPAKVYFNNRSQDEMMLGLPPNLTLKQLIGESGQPLELPENGILISDRTANKLGIRVGDRVEVETLLGLGPNRRTEIKVVGINRQLIGTASYMTLNQANRLLQERNLISGAMMKVDPGLAASLEKQIGEMNGVASILSQQKELDNFNKVLAVLVYTVAVMIIFAMILGLAIIYNASIISFAERKRELTSLRVLGFTAQEVKGLLLKETLLQSALGVAIGLPIGRILFEAYLKSVTTDLFSFKAVGYPLSYCYSALGGIICIMLAHKFSVRGVKHLNMVEVLKDGD